MALSKKLALSLRAAPDVRAFSVDMPNSKGMGAKSTSQMKRMVRSPSDEVLMTELAIDGKDLTIYDISSVIPAADRGEGSLHGEFKCYMDHTNQDFFIDIGNKTKLEAFTSSALLNLLEVAEDAGAETAYICVRKSVDENVVAKFLKSFLFIGFTKLTPAEQKKISMTQTHTLLKYKIKGQLDEY